jgi:hypothetical protein
MLSLVLSAVFKAFCTISLRQEALSYKQNAFLALEIKCAFVLTAISTITFAKLSATTPRKLRAFLLT